ncbi:MAG: phage tail tape measure protein, partial [Dysgonamonadaceae bacterium]|nr:phage tail tape measure protein [Dysgonamonadaceae bacterium]
DEEANKIKAEYQEKSFKIQKAQALASTAMAAINAYSSAASVPMIGTVLAPIAAAAAIAAGMIQVATIEKQADAAREGYHTGGFTKSGRWDEPQGVVHSDEFVANRFATANSTLRPVFDLVDYAQRNDTLSSLTKDDIARALRIPVYYAGGYAGTENKTSSSAAPQSADLSGIYGIMDALFEKLDNTLGNIRVINTVAGKEGMKEAFDRYDLIIKNKSR